MENVFITSKDYTQDEEKMPRSLLLFENAIKSPVTKKSYRFCFKQFLIFAKMEADDLLSIDDKRLQILLEDYLLYLKERISPNSIKAKLAPVELFLSMNDRNLNVKKLHKMVPETIKRSGSDTWTTQDIQKMVTFSDERRSRALIHFLASTGVRIGAIPDLKLGHVSEMPENCKCVKIYEGTKEEYLTFLTPEASESLDQYLNERTSDGEKLDSNSPLFRAKYGIGAAKAKPMSSSTCTELVKRVVRNARLVRQKNGKRYSIQLNHGFRKRYNTILKLTPGINSNIAEKLLGHKNGLDGVYFVPTREDLFREFQKGIVELTISDEKRLAVENERLRNNNRTTQDLQAEIEGIREVIFAYHDMVQIRYETDPIKREEKLMKLREKHNIGKGKPIQCTINFSKANRDLLEIFDIEDLWGNEQN